MATAAHRYDESPLANIEAEAALLGSLMANNRLVDQVADMVAAEDFFEPVHARMFDTILAMTAAGTKANPVTMFPQFKDDEALSQIGGTGYLAKLTGDGSIASIGYRENAEQIADFAARRRLISALQSTEGMAANMAVPLAETVDASDVALVAAVEKRDKLKQPTAAECFDEALARIADIQKNDGKVGATTGIRELDELTGGFEPGNFVVIGGRPGMGKTALLCSAALGLGRQNEGVLIASMEMKGRELAMRMMADLCYSRNRGIPYEKIVQATVNADESRQLYRAREDIANWPISIVDAGVITMSRLALGIRRNKRRLAARGVKLTAVFVDYLQLLHPDDKTIKMVERVSEVSRCLKAIANDCDVAVIALAQLNRAVEQREDKRPIISDLRESGQIEQDADTILFLYRDEYYLRKLNPRSEIAKVENESKIALVANKLELICAKRRSGREGHATVGYFPSFQAIRSAGFDQ